MTIVIITHLCLALNSFEAIEMDLKSTGMLFCVPQYIDFNSAPFYGKCYENKDYKYICKTKTIMLPKVKPLTKEENNARNNKSS
tara:strand:- start:3037 stop:3288 length:252 start_codon:yes stop_codon:yes gene_type:complete